jgi:hypothetical protein
MRPFSTRWFSWVVAQLLPVVLSSTSLGQGRVQVIVSLDYMLGGPQPVSGAVVYLVPSDPRRILAEKYELPFPQEAAPGDIGRMKSADELLAEEHARLVPIQLFHDWMHNRDNPSGRQYFRSGLLALKEHAVATGTTDVNGEAEFDDHLLDGRPWVFTFSRSRDSNVYFWFSRLPRVADRFQLDQTNFVAMCTDSAEAVRIRHRRDVRERLTMALTDPLHQALTCFYRNELQ